MEETENPENSGVSEPTEGEQDESTEGEETPVIDTGDNSDENQDQEETPDVEENPIEKTEEEAPTDNPAEETGADSSILSEDKAEAPAAPEIIVKNHGNKVTDLEQALPNRAQEVTFEIKAAEDVTYRYTFGDTAPTKNTGDIYGMGSSISVSAPEQDTESSVKINAIAVITPASGEALISEVKTVTVKFAARKTISLSDESEPTDGIKICLSNGESSWLTKEAPYAITDPEQRHYVRVDKRSDDDLIEVMYRYSEEDGDDGRSVWTSAYEDEGNGYRIPNDKLNDNLELKVVNMRKITLDWQGGANWNSIGISASAVREDSNNHGNLIVFGDQLKEPGDMSDPRANKIYAPKGTKVELAIYPLSNQSMQLSKVALKKGTEAAVDQTIEEGASKFVVSENITDDYTLTIDGTASYQRALLANTEEGVLVPDKQGNYNVAPYTSYELSAKKADGTAFTIGKVKVTEGTAESNAINAEDISGNKTAWYLSVLETAANKTLQVEIYADAADAEPVDKLTLKVAPVITGVTIKGAKDGKITQQIGTTVKYALTLNNDSKGSKDGLQAWIKTGNADNPYSSYNDCVKEVCVEDGNLVVKTSAAVAGKQGAATIVIRNVANGKEIATVTLDTQAPTWDVSVKGGVAPTLKQVSATDTSLTMDITAPKGALLDDADSDDGVVYVYKVEANEKNKTDKKTKYVKATAQTTRFTFKVSDAALGKGAKADYEVTAAMFLYNGAFVSEDSQPTGTKVAESKKSAVLKHATRDVYYADKITMKKEKAASALYTGQERAHVATVDFGKAASYNSGADVEIYDIPAGLTVEGERNRDGSVTLDNDLKVVVSASKDMAPGKYTIKARTTYNKDADNAGSSIVQATASLPVTVVRGIYSISATAPAKIYTAGKGATAKIAVTYNNGDKSTTPKTKKVTYELKKNWDDDESITVPGITVANGTIKIDKSYQLKDTRKDPDANKYTVYVQAADYQDNDTYDYVEFEVTGTATSLGEVAIVKPDGYNNNYVDMTPKSDGEAIAINELYAAQVVVVKQGRNPVHGRYESEDFVKSDLYTLTIPKGINSRGAYLYPEKIGKNLVIKATPVDGSDKKGISTKKFTIGYDNSVPANEVKVWYETNLDFVDAEGFLQKGGKVTLADVPEGTVLTLSLTDKDDYPLEDNNSVYDYALSAKNAKVVRKGSLSTDVIVTKNPATITLKKGKTVVGTYDIEIPDLGNEGNGKKLKDATPKVSLKKGTKIYPNNQRQELGFTMNKAVEGARYVKVSPQGNDTDTMTLCEGLSSSTATLNATDKEFSFELYLYNYDVLKKGASLAFVFLDRDGKALTKTTNTIKIKTTALKKSYKLDAKYTLSTKDAFSAPLTGKGNSVNDVTFDKLYNANFKGSVNKFREGFKLADAGTDYARIELRINEQTGKAVAEGSDWTKNDFTGFVAYTVHYEDETTEEFVSKIQVNLKKTDKKGVVPTAKKYAASAVSVLNPGATGTVEGVSYVTTGKLNADIRAARLVYSTKNGKDVSYALDNANSPVQVKKISGNEITFTIKGSSRNETYNKAKLYVLPLSGMYAYDNNYMNWSAEDWQTFGVELKCSVSLKGVNSKGKIKNPAKSVSFLNVAAEKLAVDGKGKMYYYAELPYTAGICVQIDDIKNPVEMVNKQTKNNPADFTEMKDLIKVRKVSNKNALGIYIDAEKFDLKVADDPAWSGAIFKQIGVTVHFVGETKHATKPNQYTAAPPESFNISLTLPNPWSAMSANEGRLIKIISTINGANAKVDGIAYSSYDPLEREVLVTANDPSRNVKTAVDGAKNDMATELLKDAAFKNWISKLASIKVSTDVSGSMSAGTTIEKGTLTDQQFLVLVVDTYVDRLLAALQREDSIENPTWGDLENKEIGVKITANSSVTGIDPQTEECTVRFVVDEEAGKDGLDLAIDRALEKLNRGEVIDSITGEYDPVNHVVTITGSDPEMDFIDSKNQGRDRTVQILLSELGEYMDQVEEVTFSHQYETNVRDSITVKKNGQETSEQYIANLVDKWTDKLVKELNKTYNGEGNPNAYGRLRGKELSVEAKFSDDSTKIYTIRFECEEILTGLDEAISNATRKLGGEVPGVSYVNYDASSRTIAILGDNADQDITESKDAGRDATVRILLNEMGEYMNEVSEVTFTHGEANVRDSVTVKREDHQSTETYISDLVDKWTGKLVGVLNSKDLDPNYGSLDGKALQVEVKYNNPERPVRTYTITFEIQ